jgi:hypothetical protein
LGWPLHHDTNQQTQYRMQKLSLYEKKFFAEVDTFHVNSSVKCPAIPCPFPRSVLSASLAWG